MRTSAKGVLAMVFFAFSCFTGCRADEKDMTQVTVEALIAQLALIDTQGPGLHGTAIVGGFIGTDSPPTMLKGVIGSPRPNVSPAMRELVRRGAEAIPLLVAHIDDATPTKLVIGEDGKDKFWFMWRVFTSEYDPPDGESREISVEEYKELREKDRNFDGPYTVKVGDVCFAILGQILGRQYVPVGYRPTAGLAVNSPIESPELAEWVKRDWQHFDKQKHRELLLKDAHKNADSVWHAVMSLERLRFYFPDEYAQQARNGGLKSVIEAFEKAEKDISK